MKKKPLIYIAGPLSKGVVSSNIRRAILAGHDMAMFGYGVFIPHLNFLWEIAVGGQDYEFWLDQDMQVLAHCDVLFALDGESPGRDREVQYCKENGIPVVYTNAEATEWIKTYEAQTNVSH